MFRFNLQQVLDFRRQTEELKELEFAQARRAMQQELDRLVFFRERRDSCQKDLLEREKRGISPAELAIYSSYVASTKEKIATQAEAVENARREVAKKKAALVAARRDRKSLDRLRSRRYAAFQMETRRKEIHDLDEIALRPFQTETVGRRG